MHQLKQHIAWLLKRFIPTFLTKGVIIGKMQWCVGYRCVNWEDGTVLSATHLNLIGLIYQLSGNDTSLKDLTTEEIEITMKEWIWTDNHQPFYNRHRWYETLNIKLYFKIFVKMYTRSYKITCMKKVGRNWNCVSA
jgi:hypothetical protein